MAENILPSEVAKRVQALIPLSNNPASSMQEEVSMGRAVIPVVQIETTTPKWFGGSLAGGAGPVNKTCYTVPKGWRFMMVFWSIYNSGNATTSVSDGAYALGKIIQPLIVIGNAPNGLPPYIYNLGAPVDFYDTVNIYISDNAVTTYYTFIGYLERIDPSAASL